MVQIQCRIRRKIRPPHGVVCDNSYCPIAAIRAKVGRGRVTRETIEVAARSRKVGMSDIPDALDPSSVVGISIACRMEVSDILEQEGTKVSGQFQEPRFLGGSAGGLVYGRIQTG